MEKENTAQKHRNCALQQDNQYILVRVRSQGGLESSLLKNCWAFWTDRS